MKEFTFSLMMLFAIGGYAQRSPFVTMQYAGSIGYISMGGGITSKSQKVQHELLYGFIPKAYGGPLDKITYKFTYLPANWHLSQHTAWRPLNVSAFAAYNMGRNFSLQPSFKKYHEDYYWWSPALRFHLAFSTALELSHKKSPNKGLLYIEANTNDRYITTWWDNTSKLKLHDIFFLGVGMKVILN